MTPEDYFAGQNAHGTDDEGQPLCSLPTAPASIAVQNPWPDDKRKVCHCGEYMGQCSTGGCKELPDCQPPDDPDAVPPILPDGMDFSDLPVLDLAATLTDIARTAGQHLAREYSTDLPPALPPTV